MTLPITTPYVQQCIGADSTMSTGNLALVLMEEPRQTSSFATLPLRGCFEIKVQ